MSDRSDQELERFRELKTSVYSTYLEEIKADDTYYRLQFESDFLPDEWLDSGLEAVIPPTAYNAVENASDHVLVTPKIYVPPRPTTKDRLQEEQLAEKKRQFLASYWDQLATNNKPLEMVKKKLIKDGKGVLKCGLKWNVIPDYPNEGGRAEKRRWQRTMSKIAKSKFLWTCEVIPNETVFEDPDHPNDPYFVFENYRIRRSEAKRLYPGDENSDESWRNGGDFTDVDYLEYWSKPEGADAGKFIVWIDDEVVHESENPYSWKTDVSSAASPDYEGYVPYIIRDSGWGDVDSRKQPEDRYVGILRYMRSLVVAEARQLTSAEAQLRISTFPMIDTVGMPAVEGGESPIEVGPGKINNRDDDATQKITIMPWPDMPSDVWNMLQKVQNEANALSKFGTLGGSPQKGVDSATEADMNIRNASAKLNGIVSAIQSMVTVANRWTLQDIDNIIKAPVTLRGSLRGQEAEMTVGPGDINGFYETSVELTTTDKAALDIRNARVWIDLAQASPALSHETALIKGGVEDVLKEMERRGEENVFFSPEATQARTMAALMATGEYGQAIAQKMMAEAQQAGQPAQQPGQNSATRVAPAGGGATGPIVSQAQQNAQVQQAGSQYGAGG